MNQARKTYGFTIFELSLVVAIVSILATATLFAKGYIHATHLSKTYQSIDRLKGVAEQIAASRGGEAFTVASPNLLPSVFERGLLLRQGTHQIMKIGPGLEITALFMTSRLDNQKITAITLGPIDGLGGAAARAEPLAEGIGREIVMRFQDTPHFVNGGPIETSTLTGTLQRVCNRRNSGRNVSTIVLCFYSAY